MIHIEPSNDLHLRQVLIVEHARGVMCSSLRPERDDLPRSFTFHCNHGRALRNHVAENFR